MTEQEKIEWLNRMADAEEGYIVSAGGPPFFDAQAPRPHRNGAADANGHANGTPPAEQPAKSPSSPRETP